MNRDVSHSTEPADSSNSGAAARPSRTARPRSSNFELYAWLFTRITGVLLLVLALVHLVLMHLVNNVDVINYNFVAQRWALLSWRAFDFALLLFALTHGLNGLRVIVDDYIHPRRWRMFAYAVLGLFVVTFAVAGSVVVLTFQPVRVGS